MDTLLCLIGLSELANLVYSPLYIIIYLFEDHQGRFESVEGSTELHVIIKLIGQYDLIQYAEDFSVHSRFPGNSNRASPKEVRLGMTARRRSLVHLVKVMDSAVFAIPRLGVLNILWLHVNERRPTVNGLVMHLIKGSPPCVVVCD